MTASGHNQAHTIEARFVRFGRKATKHVRTLFDRFWLQAEVPIAAIFVGFTFSSGHSDADLADAPLPPP